MEKEKMFVSDVRELLAPYLVEIGGLWEFSDKYQSVRYINDTAAVNVSIQRTFDNELLVAAVFLDFDFGELDFTFVSHKPSPSSIDEMFAAYKKIKGE